MLDPVEIPININGNAQEESKAISQSIDQIANSSKLAENELKKSIALQQQHLARLKSEIAKIEQTINESPAAKAGMSQALNALKRELIDETEGLRHLQAELKMTSMAKETLRTKMYGVRDEMARLRQAGLQNSQQYQQHRSQLQQLNEAYQGVVREQQLMTKGSASMTGVVNGLQGLLGVITASVGAMGALTGESEKYAQIQTKVQSLLAITIGLQQAQQAFSSTSAFRVHTVTKAKQAYGRVLQWLTGVMKGNAVAAKVMMGAMTAGIGLLVGAGITALDKWISKQREAKKETEDFNKSVANYVASTIAKYEKLRATYVALGDDIDAKNKFVRDSKQEFEELGIKVTDVNDAENIFVQNVESFREAVIAKAKATASFELAAELYKNGVEKMINAEERAKNVNFWDMSKAFITTAGTGKMYTGQDFANDASKKLEDKANKDFDKADQLIQKYLEYNDQFDDILEKAGIKTFSGKTSNATDNFVRECENALKRLLKISEDVEKESTALVLAAMEDGRKKKLKQLEVEHQERKAKIKEQLQEIAEIQAKYGVDVSTQRNALKNLEGAIDANYKDQVKGINEASDAIMREVQADVDARFATRLQQQLSSVDHHYNQLLDRAKQHAESEAKLEEARRSIEAARLRDIALLNREHELRQLDLAERIQLRELQMQDEGFAYRVDKEEAYLQLSLELAKKRLAKLEEIKAAGGDAGEDIAEVTAEIKELSSELEKIPVRKLEEIASGVKGIFSAISAVGGEVGEVFSELASSVDGVMTSFKEGAKPMDIVASGIQGLTRLWGMAQQQLEENKQALDAWNDALQESEHRQRMMQLATLDYRESNIFGVENPYARAIAGAKQYTAAMHELGKSLAALEQGQVKTGTKKVISGKNIATGVGAGAAAGAAIGSFIPVIGNAIGAAIGAGIGAVIGGIFGATQRKAVPVFDSLVKTYGTIIKQGSKTFELNPKIIADYQKLDDATKKLVDNWEEIRKKALDAQKQMEENFKALAGDLGQALSQSLISAWRDGELYRAVDDYGAHVGKTIEGIVEQLVFAQYFQGLFDDLEDRMKASYDQGGDGDIVDDIVWMYQQLPQYIEGYGKAMGEAKRQLEAQGIKAFEAIDPRRKAEARGIARASQDDITKFNGQMTLVVEKVGTIVAIMEADRSVSIERLNLMKAIYSEIQVIARNSAYLSDLREVKSDIKLMRKEGITLKK